jgi:fatty acid kinase fatty acid binding subunit
MLTPENTVVVTDSTADPNDRWPALGITVVPLKVVFGDEMFDDGTEMSPPLLYERLKEGGDLPTSSQPSVAQFADVYAELGERYDHILSIHISGEMSGTIQSATAAAEGNDKVEVYDSRSVSCGLGLLVDRTQAKIKEGIELEDLRAYIRGFQERGRVVVLPGTLEYLRRGGRIGRAQEMVGGVLGIRPIVHTLDGIISPHAKVRGERRAWEAMGQYLAEYTGPQDKVYLSIVQADNPGAVERLRDTLLGVRPDATVLFAGWAGSVVGVHIGPGACAYAVIAE